MKTRLAVIFRTMFRNKAYTALNVTGLAIGLACFGMIAAWVANELSYDRFHSNHARIVRLVGRVATDSETFDQAVTSPPMAEALKRDYPEVENAVRIMGRGAIVRYGDKVFDEDRIIFADQSFFDVFSYTLKDGDQQTALKDPYSIILTESMARKYFGEQNPVGRTLTVFQFDPSGRGAPYTITGVIPDPPANSHIVFKFLASFNTYEAAFPEARTGEWRWFQNSFYTYLLLRNESDRAALEAKLPQFAERYLGEKMKQIRMLYTFSLQPLTDIYLHSHLRYELQASGSMDTVVIFATIGGLVLLVACINYMNLATARALTRAKEVGIKKILGAAKGHLVRQFLLESVTLSFIALILAFLGMELIRPFVAELTGKPLENTVSPGLLLLLIGTTLLVGIGSGLYPALFISSFKPLTSVKAWGSSKAGTLVRKGLVIVQFSVSIILLIGIGVVWTQMDYIRSKDLGFNHSELLILNQSGFSEVNEGIGPFRQDLLSYPGITGVATSRGLIVGGLSNSHIETVDGTGRPVSTSIYQQRVGLNYLDVYQMKLMAGRAFVPADTGSAFIVNEAAVRAFGWKKPELAVGKPFKAGDSENRIIGVVQDFHFSSLGNPIEPVALSLARPSEFTRIAIRLAGANLGQSVAFVEQTWKKHFPEALLEYSFMNDRLERQYRAQSVFEKVFLSFVLLSLMVACLGLFGLSSFTTEQRMKEVGIRKVLGSSVPGILMLLSADFVKLVLAAYVLASPLAYVIMSRWLNDFAYRAEMSAGVFVMAGGAALFIAFVTVGIQAIRAALSNPVEALRYE